MATAASSKASSESAKWRKQGNEFYHQATKKEGLAPVIRKSRLQEALRCYQKSMSSSTSTGDLDGLSSAAKNYAKATYAVIPFHIDDFPQKIYFYKECLSHYSKAISYGVKSNKPLEWQHDIKISFRELYEEILEMCGEIPTLSERTGVLESFTLVIDKNDVIYVDIFHEIASMWLNDAFMALNEKGFKRSMHSLKEMYHPIEEMRRCGKHRHDIMNELKVLDIDMAMQLARTESLQVLSIGDELLESHLLNDDDLNMDLLYTIIDNYRHCMVLTRDKEIEVEAIALSRLGRVYDQVLKIKYRAKKCFQTCIQIAHSLAPRNFATESWYKLATETLQKYQEETIQQQDENKEKERQKYLKEIELEMKQLREAKQDFKNDDAGFLLFVYKTFPPKVTCKIPKSINNDSKGDLKKLFLKAVTYYHPDKQDVEQFGMKWKILSGEITKILTGVYESYKIII